jgi:protein-S-isoprenylcysteine O-methyltransferase Ste14
MHLFDQRILGVLVLLLMAMLVAVKRIATGSILEKPTGGLLARSVNTFNLFFLLVVNPLAAVLLLLRRMDLLDCAQLAISTPWLLRAVEIAGLVIYVAGFFLMAWALRTLGTVYQLGGSEPRAGDRLITSGPYALLRHPMYSAALAIALGLALVLQSWVFLAVFATYCVLLLLTLPGEEESLRKAYGDAYAQYARRSGRLLPALFRKQ